MNIRSLVRLLEGDHADAPDLMILSIDLEKAFDSLEWIHLRKVLERFGLGEGFLRWTAPDSRKSSQHRLNDRARKTNSLQSAPLENRDSHPPLQFTIKDTRSIIPQVIHIFPLFDLLLLDTCSLLSNLALMRIPPKS
ncbi:uncharacterized protein LOC144826398 [Lissotriton helveticus]